MDVFFVPAAAKPLPQRQIGSFVEKGNGQDTQQQRNHDHRRCYGNGCYLFLLKEPQLKPEVSAARFPFLRQKQHSVENDVGTARSRSDPERRRESL